MIALILGNGEVSEKIIPELPKNPYVICADGGFRHIKTLGVSADIIVGDMDSVTEDISDEKTIKYPVKKNFTDSEIAVDYALKKGFDEIVMVGFIGTRIDHTLTNLFLLKRIYDAGAKGVIIDKNNFIYYAGRENIISGKKGDFISIVPIGEDVLGITTSGLYYPLNNETLEFAKGRGISNVMTEDECRIDIKKGKALIIKSKD